MEFIVRSDVPQTLEGNRDKWTKPWIEHYRWQKGLGVNKQPKKPSTSYWLKEVIRKPLSDDFQQCCGYCGLSIPTPLTDDERMSDQYIPGKGDVDHLLPKSAYPEKTYQWQNYVWTCKACNQHKKDWFNEQYPMPDPSVRADCENVRLYEQTGSYGLHKSVRGDIYWQKRLWALNFKTLINAAVTCKKRKKEIALLTQKFESAERNLLLLQQQSVLNNPLFNDTLNYQLQEYVSEIGLIKDQPDFKPLITKAYQRLCQNHPHVTEYLTTND